MQEIQGVHLEAARNAAHYELVHQILEFAEACQAVTQNMAAELAALKQSVDHEGYLLGISLRSEITEKLDITDRERDGEVTGAKAVANALTKHPTTEIADAASQLMNEFISLKVDTAANYLQQTGQIDILLSKLQGAYAQQVEVCGLTKVIEFLAAANDRMHQLLNERDLEQAPRSGAAMEEARRATDTAYRAFIKLYNAWILVNASSLASNDLGTIKFSTETNTKIDYFKRYVLKEPTSGKPGEITPGEGTEGDGTGGENGGTTGGSGSTGGSSSEEEVEKFTIAWYDRSTPIQWYELAPGEPVPAAPEPPTGYRWAQTVTVMPAHDVDIVAVAL